MERERELTEQKLINALGELIEEKGFEKVGVNVVAERAGVSKMLIYRYFKSLDGLIYEYIKRHDFWINASSELPSFPELNQYLKNMFREEIAQFRENITLKRLRRWELSSSHPVVVSIREKREEKGQQMIRMVSKLSEMPQKDLAAVSSLINAGITYLVLLEDNCHIYNGINIQTDEGWEQIARGIDILIDLLY